jgi:hypothetical protein
MRVLLLDTLFRTYPAPLCAGCNEPMWAKRRVLNVSRPAQAVQLGFECCRCRTYLNLKGSMPLLPDERGRRFGRRS